MFYTLHLPSDFETELQMNGRALRTPELWRALDGRLVAVCQCSDMLPDDLPEDDRIIEAVVGRRFEGTALRVRGAWLIPATAEGEAVARFYQSNFFEWEDYPQTPGEAAERLRRYREWYDEK